ncbi:CD166 antigen homolog isoform X1 [Acipenser ruthenus]|uniref:CD166 antigen homolog isoform X1 n=1 Tax=Acipenser ruthenus TaxID=7906 RepID=UPI00145BC8BC|nr:CD166 antigen homolog isoform X1 [Acipenser ruthenus]
MDSSAVSWVTALFAMISALALQVEGIDTVSAIYGETITVPCNDNKQLPEGVVFVKWKYEQKDGTSQSLLTKSIVKDRADFDASPEYVGRLDIGKQNELLVYNATLQDQRRFNCMVATTSDVIEHLVNVKVYKKPSKPEITESPKYLDVGKLQMIGKCISKDGNPQGNTTWYRNGALLESDGKTVDISDTAMQAPVTGLITTTSVLRYAAQKTDVRANFTCNVQHFLDKDQESGPVTFPIYYPSEKVKIEVLTPSPIREGDSVTLKCSGDGSPPPASFTFFLKDKKENVENSNNYTIESVSRNMTGDYSCSLLNDENLKDTATITVHYLDMILTPVGSVTKEVGQSVNVTLSKASSADLAVTWKKDNVKIDAPTLQKLAYRDAGNYECEVTAAAVKGLKKTSSFQLIVEGKPHIKNLIKKPGQDGKTKTLSCIVEGSPKPTVHWNVNASTVNESPYVNGQFTHTITMIPQGNDTVYCTVSNKLGQDQYTVNVSTFHTPSSKSDESEDSRETNDQTKLIVGVVVGLIVAALVAGLIYWIYMKKSKQGSWKTGEKDRGSHEENKKLEENNHKSEA